VNRFFLVLLLLLYIVFNGYTLEPQKTDEKPLLLNITFPALQDTFALNKVRISGVTDSLARIFIDTNSVKVFPNGAFVSRVNLEPGLNVISIRAEKGNQIVNQDLIIYRPPDFENSPEKPTVVDDRLVEPTQNIMLLKGDFLNVKFKASPGGNAYFSINKIAKNLPMVELPPEQANGLSGVYNGIIRISEGPTNRALKIKFEIRGKDRKKKTLEAPGKLYILSEEVPIIGQILKETWMHSVSHGFMPLTRVPESVIVHIIGKIKNRYKVKLSPSLNAYVEETNIHLLPWGTPLPHTKVSAPVILTDNDWYLLRMRISKQVPFRVEQVTNPSSLNVYFYGANLASHWITFPNDSIEIKQITFDQIEEHVLKVRVELDQKQQWGYRAFYDDKGFNLKIRKTPKITAQPDSPVKGLIFAIDPGHGGDNEGAISPTGVLEKQVNLEWANLLVDSLKAAGAKVLLTRSTDENISLIDRVNIARKANAHFLISLHNNSTTAGGNALAVRGSSTYFTLPQNKEFAWTIYPYLVKLGLVPYGRIYNSYFITRTTDMLVVLIEGGFLSHPEEELLLTNNEFLQKMTGAVFNGIEEFLSSQQSKN